MNPFVVGQEYPRARLLEFLGSRQMQSGVLWGSGEPGCLICTSGGRGGRKAGYSDVAIDAGGWWYFGQGQAGDQELRNAANAKLAAGTRSVLLFTTREPTSREVATRGGYGKLFSFRGAFNVLGFEFFVPIEGHRKGDRLLRFRLMPASEHFDQDVDVASAVEVDDLSVLQDRLNSEVRNAIASRIGSAEYRTRSAAVHRYARLRAAGMCEGCGNPAPFIDSHGYSFLEVHHLTRLVDDGLDEPVNVAAICPNCHRRAHHAMDREEFGRRLRERVAAAEKAVACRMPSQILVPQQAG